MNRTAIRQFVLAESSAGIATIIDFGMTIVLAKLCGMYYVHAVATGAICGGIANFIINRRFVFQCLDRRWAVPAMKYISVWAGSILLNTYGTYLLTEASGMDFIIAKIIVAIVVAVFWNFMLQKYFVFRK